MRRFVPLAIVVLGVVAAALLRGEPEPRGHAAAALRTPLLGLVDAEYGPGALVRLEPRTLRPTSRRLRMRGHTWARAWSPDGRRLAIAVAAVSDQDIQRSRIQIVDVRRWRTTAVIEVDPHTEVSWLAWPAEERIIALHGPRGSSHGVAVVDPRSKTVLRRSRLPGQVLGDSARPAAGGLAVLLAPPTGIGPATLAHVTATHDRWIALPGTTAGFDQPPLGPTGPRPAARQRVPGLAVDCDRAYVVEAGGPGIVEVDLRSGTATRREPQPRRTLLERLRDVFEAPAEAQATEGPWRDAHVIAPGRLAVTGRDDVDGTPDTARPYGLRLVDTETWRYVTVDEAVRWVTPAPDALVIADGGRGPRSGVTVLGLDGRERFRLLDGREAGAVAAGGLLYATDYGSGRLHVADLRTGRPLHGLPPQARQEIVTASEPPCR